MSTMVYKAVPTLGAKVKICINVNKAVPTLRAKADLCIIVLNAMSKTANKQEGTRLREREKLRTVAAAEGTEGVGGTRCVPLRPEC